jgi:pimeloyl-ACP methyl ester carboxylesterase
MRSEMVSLGEAFGGVRLHYTAWGLAEAERAVICVHGLTRNARDFDRLAEVLAAKARVYCVDVAGRGRSDRLPDPALYRTDVYAAQLLAFIAAMKLEQVDWVGTSMGGLIGMGIAAMETNPIRRLVLNDIGPFLPKAALETIGSYVGHDLRFADVRELEAYLRKIHAPFGPLSDAEWAEMAAHSGRQDADGWRLAYDPAIRQAFTAAPFEDVDLWPLYEAIRCPTLVLRGAESTLLTAETAQAMTERGPKAQLVTFAGVGHAPALLAADQIEAVRRFLEA